MNAGLKALPATYRFTHNQSDLDRASEGWDLLFKYHGRPSGIFAADEYLAGLGAVRGCATLIQAATLISDARISALGLSFASSLCVACIDFIVVIANKCSIPRKRCFRKFLDYRFTASYVRLCIRGSYLYQVIGDPKYADRVRTPFKSH